MKIILLQGRANKNLSPIAKKILLGIKTPENFYPKSIKIKRFLIGNILEKRYYRLF